MSKSFNDIYNEIYSKYGAQIAEVQNARKKKVKIALMVYAVILLLLILCKAYFLILHISIFYLVISTIVISLISGKKGNNVYKTGVITDLVHEAYPHSEYNYIKGISSYEYNSRAFNDHYDRYHSEDLVVTNNAINLTFSEVHTETVSTDEDGHTTYTTSFLGIAGYCDLVKPLNTKLYITSNRFLSKRNKTNVQVDMPEFEKTFDVFAENKITAMGLLTADVMTEFLDIKKELGSMFELAIERNKIYFRMHTGDSFEMSLWKDSMGVNKIKKYYYLLCHVDKITQMINNHINELEI